MGSEDLVGEEVDGERTEGKDRRIERKAQSDDKPIGRVETENLPELQLVDGTGLSKFVPSLCPALENPIDNRAEHG